MKITAMITEVNILNSRDACKTPVIKESTARPGDHKGINRASAGNNVRISDRALEFSRIREVLKNLPEIREDKIKSISNQLLIGEYKVSAEHIASRLLSEHIVNELSGE